MIATTLAAHGVRAATMAYARMYPSVDWVRGYRVAVPADDARRAREVLSALAGRDDVALVDAAGSPTTRP